jgi:hypothetical protein
VQFAAKATAFLLGFGIMGLALFGLAFRFPHAWMPIALGSFMAGAVGYSKWTPKGSFNFWLGVSWVSGTFLLWLLSSGVRLPIGQVMALRGLGAFVVLSLAVTVGMAFSLKGPPRRVAGWLLGTLFFGMCIAYLSGPPGKLSLLKQLLDLIGAGDASFAVRKVGHFLFYGLLAWFTARSSLAAGNGKRDAVLFALIVTLAVAGYDELRQSTHPQRVGSPVDVLIDLAGALTLLAFTKATKGVRSQ